MKRGSEKIKLTSFDELFGTHDMENVTSAKLDELYDFPNHPFQVSENEEMLELIDSIKEYGILIPLLVRPRKQGGYEIIAGHRRKYAARKAELDSVPIIIRDLSDDDAVIFMVDSNIQRENILPSERAFSLAMKYDALSHQGKISGGKHTCDIVGEGLGISGRQVKRYIRLTKLVPDLLDMIDNKKIAMVLGVELSFLDSEIQQWIVEEINSGIKITSEKIELIKKENKISREILQGITRSNKNKRETRKVTISEKKLNTFFEASYSVEEIEDIICSLLEQWKTQNGKVV